MNDKKLPEFVPGLKLSEQYYREAVQPILAQRYPGLAHSAALIGFGSDVIGFDDMRSRDHMWGPRLVLFLPEDGFDAQKQAICTDLSAALPTNFYGYPTSFSAPDKEGVRLLEEREEGPVDPLVEITTLPGYFEREIAWNTRRPLDLADWLTFSEHKLLSLTTGGVWHDGLGLEAVRKQLAYYPREIWMYLLACQWNKIGQEEPFVGRTAEVGDEIGSRMLTARMVQAVMHLCFMMEQRYTPYSKWFGTGFKRLETAALIEPNLVGALEATDFHMREQYLCRAYEICAWKFNSLDLIPQVPGRVTFFHDRPFKVIHGGEIADKIMQAIPDERIRSLPGLVGSVNQLSDSTDVVSYTEVCHRLKGLYH